jgi:hypothetical protein
MAYIIVRVYSFECDRPDCDTVEEIQAPNLREARKQLTETGWFTDYLLDICPKH